MNTNHNKAIESLTARADLIARATRSTVKILDALPREMAGYLIAEMLTRFLMRHDKRYRTKLLELHIMTVIDSLELREGAR